MTLFETWWLSPPWQFIETQFKSYPLSLPGRTYLHTVSEPQWLLLKPISAYKTVLGVMHVL